MPTKLVLFVVISKFSGTKIYQSTLITMRIARCAHIAPVQDEPMVGRGDKFRGDVAAEFVLHAEGGGAGGGNQSDAMAQPEDMRVDGHAGLLEDDGLDDIGRLATDARQSLQLLACGGYLAAVFLQEHPGHAHQVSSLVVGVADALHVLQHLLWRSLGQKLWGGVGLEEPGRDHVDTLVRTLST